ncbi:hypothetical protein [Hymenobacter psoromatis]|uniref:hypothetical protein n=1 Tax=Hymenobacter psoromatis TaxID=1484116 RepID=UPI0021D436F0|nr:hypothetical protein [Hymenobacter psoromatis]
MPDKYSLAKCAQYGRRLAARLSQQFFDAQPDATLDGPALLKFTPLRQVNLLVLRQLLSRWQQEASALRSPYFDFEAAPVRAALGQFMNVLSRHIGLGRAALEPLLAQAVADTLALATDPAAAFERLLLPPAGPDPDEAVPLATLRDSLRYFDQAKPFFEGFVGSLPTGHAPLNREFLSQRFDLYLTAHRKELPALPPLVSELSALLPLTEADLWDDGPAKPVVLAPTPPPARELAAKSEPLAMPKPALTPPPAAAAEPAPTPPPTPKPVVSTPAPVLAPKPTASPTVRPAEVPLYEKLKATQAATPHLADTLREAATLTAPPLAERGAPKVGSLREAISINQRFSFINELFGGEDDDYHAAIAHLDTLPDAATATAYVRQDLARQHDWSRKEEHVGRLLKLIERKFAGA